MAQDGLTDEQGMAARCQEMLKVLNLLADKDNLRQPVLVPIAGAAAFQKGTIKVDPVEGLQVFHQLPGADSFAIRESLSATTLRVKRLLSSYEKQPSLFS